MGLNKKMYLRLAVVLCSIIIGCERSDVITGAGGGAVSGSDPTLADINGGFKLVKLEEGDVEESFSLPKERDPVFSTRFASYIYAGVSADGDTLAAYMRYRVFAFTAEKFSYTDADTVLGAHLYFQKDDTLALNDTIPVSRSNISVSGDTVTLTGTGDSLNLNGFVLDSGGIYSIPLPFNMKDSIFTVRTDTAAAAVYDFAFSITDYKGALRKIRNPYIIVRVKRVGGSIVKDSIVAGFGSTNFTAYENAEKAAERALVPFSSHYTQRTAVFKVNTSRILDSLKVRPGKTIGNELLNAVIAVWTDKYGDIAASNSGNFKIIARETLPGPDSIRILFDREAPPAALTEPYSVYSTQAIKNVLKKVLGKPRGSEPAHMYILLRPDSDRGSILWDKDKLTIETIFTPSRLQ